MPEPRTLTEAAETAQRAIARANCAEVARGLHASAAVTAGFLAGGLIALFYAMATGDWSAG